MDARRSDVLLLPCHADHITIFGAEIPHVGRHVVTLLAVEPVNKPPRKRPQRLQSRSVVDESPDVAA